MKYRPKKCGCYDYSHKYRWTTAWLKPRFERAAAAAKLWSERQRKEQARKS